MGELGHQTPDAKLYLSIADNYVKTGVISSNYNLKSGFKVSMKTNISSFTNAFLYNLKQATATGQATPQTFCLWGYRT